MHWPQIGTAEVNVSWILGVQNLPGHVDPHALALRWVNGQRTYSELRDRALRLAGALRRLGLEPGDRVGVHFFNRGETFELYFACAYAGLIMVPISFRLTPREIGSVVEDCEPKLVFTESELRPNLDAGVKEASADAPQIIELAAHAEDADYTKLVRGEPITELGHSDIQLLLYTSGTTGRPKGVEMRHHSIMWFAFQQAVLYQGLNDHAVTMLTGPMYNTAAINEQSIPTLLAGGTVTIMPSRGWKPQRMAELMAEWGVTHALIYPSMMTPMLDADLESPLPLDSLRFVLSGGENCPPALMKRFKERWTAPHLCVAYGSTETGCPTLLWDAEIWGKKAGSVGRPSGGQVVAVVDETGTFVDAGVIGEIVTIGPAVTSGYWNAPNLTSDAFISGWFKTGDLGRIDEEGYVYIEGRSKDMIISKGQNIYPAEIESVLREHVALADASVVGIPDEEAGEAVCACVVLRLGSEVSPDTLRAFVQERLASYKKPKHVVYLSDLPRNPSGKVLKKELRSMALERIGGAR